MPFDGAGVSIGLGCRRCLARGRRGRRIQFAVWRSRSRARVVRLRLLQHRASAAAGFPVPVVVWAVARFVVGSEGRPSLVPGRARASRDMGGMGTTVSSPMLFRPVGIDR